MDYANIEWVLYGGKSIETASFIGGHTVLLTCEAALHFYNLKNKAFSVPAALGKNKFEIDGVKCACGHPVLNIFAVADCAAMPNIFLYSYPRLNKIGSLSVAESQCTWEICCLEFTKGDFLAGLANPKNTLCIWNWRSCELIFTCSAEIWTPPLSLKTCLGEADGCVRVAVMTQNLSYDGLKIWEIWSGATLTDKLPVNTVQIKLPLFITTFAWLNCNELILLSNNGSLYQINWEGNKEIQEIYKSQEEQYKDGKYIMCICDENELVLANDLSGCLLRLSRTGGSWTVTSSIIDQSRSLIILLPTNPVTAISGGGELIKLEQTKLSKLEDVGIEITLLAIIEPGTYFLTYTEKSNTFLAWELKTGSKVAVSNSIWNRREQNLGHLLLLEPHPWEPFAIAASDSGHVGLVSLRMKPTIIIGQHPTLLLSYDAIDSAKFSVDGEVCCVCAKTRGHFFFLKFLKNLSPTVLCHLKLSFAIADFALGINKEGGMILMAVTSILNCCRSGSNLLVYSIPKKGMPEFLFEEFLARSTNQFYYDSENEQIIMKCHRSKSLYVTDSTGKGIYRILTGHQLRSVHLRMQKNLLVTFSEDGLIILRNRQPLSALAVIKGIGHHRTGGIRKLYLNLRNQCMLVEIPSGFTSSSLVCVSSRFLETANSDDWSPQTDWEHLNTEPELNLKITLGCSAVTVHEEASRPDISLQPTWLELQQEDIMNRLKESYSGQVHDLQERFVSVQSELEEILKENNELEEDQRLPLSEFELDKEARNAREATVLAKIAQKREEAALRNETYETLAEQMGKSWRNLEIRSRRLRSLSSASSAIVVESFALPRPNVGENDLNWITFQNRLQKTADYKKFFPWKTAFPESNKEKVTDEQLAWCGSRSYNFIKMHPDSISQFEATTTLEFKQTQIALENNIRRLMEWFNSQFNSVYKDKELEIQNLEDRKLKLRYIIDELDSFGWVTEEIQHKTGEAIEAKWADDEVPENIDMVADHELKSARYVSPEEAKEMARTAEEAEKTRVKLLTDDFRDRALNNMMDGVLEKLWQDEIKQDIPKPKCMLEKQQEDWNSEDVKKVLIWEEADAKLKADREKYRKQLLTEYESLFQSIKSSVQNFDKKLEQLYTVRLRVAAAIAQEELKILRLRRRQIERQRSKKTRLKMMEDQKLLQEMLQKVEAECFVFIEYVEEVRVNHENLSSKDKGIEKNFYKEFSGDFCPPGTIDSHFKTFRRRPKIPKGPDTTKSVLLETAQILNQHQTGGGALAASFKQLPAECIEFLRHIEQADQPTQTGSDSPPGWQTFCRLRRTKLEYELKLQANTLILAELEAVITKWQNLAKRLREKMADVQNSLVQHQKQDQYREHNIEIQLVIPQVMCELPLTGNHSEDFANACLVSSQLLTNLGASVESVGLRKEKILRKAVEFRKKIVQREWEHAMLRTELKHLRAKLDNLNHMMVTKELQSIINEYAQGKSVDERGFNTLQQEINNARERFEKSQKELNNEIEDTNEKIRHLAAENETLRRKFEIMKEKKIIIDEDEVAASKDALSKRMKDIAYKSKLKTRCERLCKLVERLEFKRDMLQKRVYPNIQI